jgi:hypothetical protein
MILYKGRMSKKYLKLLLFLMFAFASSVFADEKDKSEGKMQLVKVASLNTIDANKEFQRNVQLVQQQRSLAAELLSKLENVQDEEEHKKLQSELDSLQQKLNENNQLMFKTYGFSLNRNYVLTVEKAHIHMWVTEEEAQKIQDTEKKPKK